VAANVVRRDVMTYGLTSALRRIFGPARFGSLALSAQPKRRLLNLSMVC